MATIAAKLVAEGVGLPEDACEVVDMETGAHGQYLFEHSDGDATYFFGWSQWEPNRPAFSIDRIATAFGVALKLDKWERARLPEWGEQPGRVQDPARRAWVERLAVAHRGPPSLLAHVLEEMIARLTHIGQDHAIRRRTGWLTPPGTLWVTFRNEELGGWCMGDSEGFSANLAPLDQRNLAGIADPDEARAAIYAELMP